MVSKKDTGAGLQHTPGSLWEYFVCVLKQEGKKSWREREKAIIQSTYAMKVIFLKR